MFVVTGIHTKRRPRIDSDKSRATNRRQGVERVRLLPTVLRSHRRLRSAKRSTPIPHAIMVQYDGDKDACDRDEEGRRPPIRVPLGRVAPPRIRKFIPKPLVLVERMKARQFLPEASPSLPPESRSKAMMTTPAFTHVTPPTRRTYNALSSDSHSSSTFSVRVILQDDVVVGSGFGMVPCSVRPVSIATLGNTSSSTDTFVADSPCCVKQANFKVPLLFATIDGTNDHLDVESHPGKRRSFDPGVLKLDYFMEKHFAHQNFQLTGVFDPVETSTPVPSSQAGSNGLQSPTVFGTSTGTPGLFDSFEIRSPTSRAVYPSITPREAYVVKLPNSRSATLLSKTTRLASPPSSTVSYASPNESDAAISTFASAPKPIPCLRRLSNRSASPTLVLDGVFALPRPSSTPPRRPYHGFPRPRKPSSRRVLAEDTNAPVPTTVFPPHGGPAALTASPTPPRERRCAPESPRSKLAHVLTAHARPQTSTRGARARKPARAPPLVRGVQASNDPRTQCEIEGLRARRVVGLGRGGGDNSGCSGAGAGADSADSAGRATAEHMPLASVGMVAKLRARWETGNGGASPLLR